MGEMTVSRLPVGNGAGKRQGGCLASLPLLSGSYKSLEEDAELALRSPNMRVLEQLCVPSRDGCSPRPAPTSCRSGIGPEKPLLGVANGGSPGGSSLGSEAVAGAYRAITNNDESLPAGNMAGFRAVSELQG